MRAGEVAVAYDVDQVELEGPGEERVSGAQHHRSELYPDLIEQPGIGELPGGSSGDECRERPSPYRKRWT